MKAKDNKVSSEHIEVNDNCRGCSKPQHRMQEKDQKQQVNMLKLKII
jgi:hypothetical protein